MGGRTSVEAAARSTSRLITGCFTVGGHITRACQRPHVVASGRGARPPVKAEQPTDAMELLSPSEVDVLRLSAPLTQRDISQAPRQSPHRGDAPSPSSAQARQWIGTR